MGIKKVLDDHGGNYTKHTIVQSSNLKEKLEQCGLKRNEGKVNLEIIEPLRKRLTCHNKGDD
eukprot:10496954-Ditylum_brightwellii.AAC.1